eukprot:TRINITY_DN68150_c0_g1_i1.p1 TRINITY_DN68150_c0_g1~~TRINITY_DN68150_c0_g1_i1.p1  ORF type:complete len:262 (-),score=51.04 TRINITY_DN68150_c0_g1_i1:221-1006(-)
MERFYEVNTIKDVQLLRSRHGIDEDSVAIFSVDSLIVPSNGYLQPQTLQQFSEVYEKYTKDLTPTEMRLFELMLITDGPSKLVEQDTPTVVAGIQQLTPVIGFTSSTSGGLSSDIDSFPSWCSAELQRLGINLSEVYSTKTKLAGFECSDGDFVAIEDGIVYCCGGNHKKGELLAAVLEELCITSPNKILIVDNKEEDVRSLMNASKELKIPLIVGVQYKGAEQIPKVDNVDQAVFEEHLKRLVQNTKQVVNKCSEQLPNT